MASIQSTNTKSVHPEDRELVEKLANLQSMYQRIPELRRLLPERLVNPALAALENPSRVSPETLATYMHNTVIEGRRTVDAFNKEWHNQEMRELWQKANSADFPQGRDSWNVDYTVLSKVMIQSAGAAQPPGDSASKEHEGEGEGGSEDEDGKEVVRSFRERLEHKNIQVEVLDEEQGYPLDVVVAQMAFRIGRDDSQQPSIYTVALKPNTTGSKLEQSILKIIEARDNTHSLVQLLVCIHRTKVMILLKFSQNLLAAYHDIKSKPCSKCQRIFDDYLQFPIVRKLEAKDKNDDNVPRWAAFHQVCV